VTNFDLRSVPRSHNCADVAHDHASPTDAQRSDPAVPGFLIPQHNYFCSTPSICKPWPTNNGATELGVARCQGCAVCTLMIAV